MENEENKIVTKVATPIEEGKVDSKRAVVKNLLSSLEKENPLVKKSIFNSMRNIN